MNTLSLMYFFIGQAMTPALISLGVAIIIFWVVKKRYSIKTALLSSVGVLLITALLWWPHFVPGDKQLYGPAAGPGMSFKGLMDFFKKAKQMDRVADIAKDPTDLTSPTTQYSDGKVKIELESREVFAQMADGVTFNYWTFNGTVPGPLYRVREGDTVEFTLKNHPSSVHDHNIDLHAVTGPGGGAVVTNVAPGESKTFTFKALNPGLYVYHCAHQNVATHMAHGMYGLILVEPKEGLPSVDREFYVMQGELYTKEGITGNGLQVFDAQKMLDGKPDYAVFNGRPGGATGKMQAKTGEKIRMYIGNGGVNQISSFHVIGEIFDEVYPEGSMGADSYTHKNIQSTIIPAGGAAIVEFKVDVPGKYILVDHALARMDRGAWGTLEVTGSAAPNLFNGTVDSHSHGH